MQRLRRDAQLPTRYRSSSPPRFLQTNDLQKRRRIDVGTVDRNDVDQALAVIAPAPECSNKPPQLISTELPHFRANYVQNRLGYTLYTNLSEIGCFELFFSDFVVQILSEETNSYAESKLRTYPLAIQERCCWVPTTIAEIRVYLGIHLHFGLYHLAVREDYWKIHKLGQFMGYGRFKRIHRYFSLNDENDTLPPLNAPWFHRIQRVSDLIRAACRNSYTPSSHITIDEAMVAFKGRSKHTVKLKNKPINNGYKLWCIGDHGYIWSWLFHSRVDGVEGFTKSQPTYWPQKSMNAAGEPLEKRASLAPTYALVLRLAAQLPRLEFCIYLDNLFLNLPVAQCLLAMGIYCMGTIRKKAIGFPLSLQSYLENNSELLWDSTIAQVVDNNTLCFIWQDNKPVAAISTAHSLHQSEDRIQRLRRCPKINPENQRILRPVFQGQPFKELFILKAMDDYNHDMKGVDQADQLRASFTCHRKQDYRTQMPLFYFLLDVSCVNAFLLWQRSSTVNATIAPKTHNTHRAFMSVVCDKLLYSNPKIKKKSEEETHSQSLSTMALSRYHKRIEDKCYSRCH